MVGHVWLQGTPALLGKQVLVPQMCSLSPVPSLWERFLLSSLHSLILSALSVSLGFILPEICTQAVSLRLVAPLDHVASMGPASSCLVLWFDISPRFVLSLPQD